MMNAERSLFLLDVDNIQGYIFDTNKLKTIIGASWLIDHINASDDGETFTLLKKPEYNFTTRESIDDIRSHKNFIYSSGGNTRIIFDSSAIAKKFKKVITRAYAQYGIPVTTHIQPLDDNDFIEKTLIPAESAQALKKYNKTFKTEITASPFFKICELCGKRYASRKALDSIVCDICGKRFDKRNENLRLLPEYTFVTDMKKMTLESDMIAVVIMDGNRMGKKIAAIKSVPELKKFAATLETTIKDAFDECLDEKHLGSEKKAKAFTSIRPLIMGGDDICFIIDAAIALDFVSMFQERVTKKSKKQPTLFGQEGICFSAGILFIKPNYPFNFAYRIAHSLLKSAKRYSREHGHCSAVDFHFLLTSSGDEIESSREREYMYEGHFLTQKPYPAEKLRELKENAGQLQVLARNKVKAFRGILRLGKYQSTVELLKYAVRMNKTERCRYKKILNDYGWKKVEGEPFWRTGLLDLAELTDLARR